MNGRRSILIVDDSRLACMMLQKAISAFDPETLITIAMNGAEALEFYDRRPADIAIIEGDVLSDIRRSEYVAYTMQNGRLYDTKTMNEVKTGDFKAKPLFFNRLEINAMPTATAQKQKEKAEKYHWTHH